MIKAMAMSLLITLFIELILARVMKIKDKFDLLIVTLANIATNVPCVFTILLYRTLHNYKSNMLLELVLEITVVAVEALIYKLSLKENKKSPILISLILNIASYSFGVIYNFFWIWIVIYLDAIIK